MTDPKYRIIPVGLHDWQVEQQVTHKVRERIGFFFFTAERVTEFTTWEPVYLHRHYDETLRDTGVFSISSSDRSSWRRQLVNWPRDKDEVKRILDKDIEKYREDKRLEALAEERAKETQEKIKHRLATTPIEEYP